MAMRPVAVGIFCCEPQMDGAATQLADNPGLTANGPKSNLQNYERQPLFAILHQNGDIKLETWY